MTVSTQQSQTTDLGMDNSTDHDNSAASSSKTASSPRIEQKYSITAGPGMELKPIGIHNESNTCFLNSTFQALSATAPLTTLLASSPQSPLVINPESSLPFAIVPPKLIPSLQPDILEPPLYDLLPVTRAFTNSLHRAWRMKEAGGGTYGQGETSSKRSMSLNSLLREIARKYDQYDDYSQQDAHELLRHLLDSMEMEEKDVIKKLQPNLTPLNQNGIYKRRRKSKQNETIRSGTTTPGATNYNGTTLTQQHLMDLKHISPLPSPLPSPAQTRPPSPGHKDVDPMTSDVPLNLNGQMTGHAFKEDQIFSPSETPTDVGSEVIQTIPQEKRMIPFVDVLFGGSLASVVVCERCKAVSHTYEGFLDISLSLKGDDPKPRKRDRLRAMARKFRPRKSSSTQNAQSPDVQHGGSSVVSDSELSESEIPREKDRRKSMDSDDRIMIDSNHTNSSSGLGRSGSTRAFSGLKAKPSFSFGRKKDKKAASPVIAPSSIMEGEEDRTPPTSTPVSPSLHSQDLHHKKSHHHKAIHGPGPTPAQAAYISRILAPPPGTVDLDDPIARLRAAQSGQSIETTNNSSSEYGLVDALKAFTSVEVLEGENAFACKKCWKIKHGYYAKHEATVKEEDEEQLAAALTEDGFGLPHTSTRGSVSSNVTTSSTGTSPMMISNPQISVMGSGSPSSEKSNNSSYYDASSLPDNRHGRSQRYTSTNSKQAIARAPSPLRRNIKPDEETDDLNERLASTKLSSTYGSESALTTDSGLTSNTSVSNDDLIEEDDAQDAEHDNEEESDGLSDSETSVDEHNDAHKPKSKNSKKSKNTSHVVMGRAFKRYLIAKKPEIMVFHFKRFKQTAKSYSFSSFYDLKKIDDFVSFPENLDLAPFLAPNRQDYKVHQTSNGPKATYMEWANPEQGPELEPVMYRLYALVVHLGTMIGGHYIAYCLVDPEKMFGLNKDNEENKTPTIEPRDSKSPGIGNSNASLKSQQSGLSGMSGIENNKNIKEDKRVWCFCSDTSIRLASIEEVLSQKAYLCFYEKVSS
ncbi:uncharacterized protein I206_103314 [Kwoniella pini CBS 10737]|uniref:USP domain-containing protein n=1 Tax=Kwoniella pini CBS 10737 TaxID=1296096 RepID=A0AAJ8L4G0_9TREE